jgi:hypothetical protein
MGVVSKPDALVPAGATRQLGLALLVACCEVTVSGHEASWIGYTGAVTSTI